MVVDKFAILAQVIHILALNPSALQQHGVACDLVMSELQSLLVAWSQAN